jgi:hypothetical protein
MPSSKNRDLLTYVEELLELFDHGEVLRDYVMPVSKDHILPLNYFQRVHPLLNPISDPDRLIFSDVRPNDLEGEHWDISFLNWNEEDPEENERPHYNIHRFRRANLKELRGRPLYSSIVSEHAVALLFPDAKYMTARTYAFYVNGNWLKPDRTFLEYRDSDGLQNLETRNTGLIWERESDPRVALGLQFNSFYEWNVDIRRENSLELSFVTDPIGAQEIFRLRDIPEGKARRAALRNWVMQHWRKTRDVDVKVRRHLRGAEQFNWNGLYCTIRPSPDDLRLNEKYRLEREAERRTGQGRRLEEVA